MNYLSPVLSKTQNMRDENTVITSHIKGLEEGMRPRSVVKALIFNQKDWSWGTQDPLNDGWVWQPIVISASEGRDSRSLEQTD